MEPSQARRALRLAALTAFLLGAGCSGGSDAGARAPESMLFYASPDAGLLTAVDPRAPTSPIPVEAGPAPISYVTLVRGGDHDAASRRVTRAHSAAVVYLKDDGAGNLQLFRVPAVRGASLAPVRVSSLSLPAASICSVEVEPDYADPAESVAVIRTAGDCAEDPWGLAFTRLSASATTAPVEYPVAGAEIAAAVRDGRGAIAEWLVQRGGRVYAEDLAFSEPGRRDLFGGYLEQIVFGGGDRVWFDDGGALRYYARGAAALASPGGVATTLPASYLTASDGKFLYVADGAAGGAIVRVRLDGTGAPAAVATLPDDRNAAGLAVLTARVAYMDEVTGAWYAVPKAGGAAVTLYAPASSGGYATVFAVGAAVFFNDLSGVVTFVKEDGTGAVTFGDATTSAYLGFVGGSFLAGETGAGDPRALFLVERSEGAGTVLTAIDAATGARGAVLGTVPASYDSVIPLADGSGTVTLVSGLDADGNGDVFSLDVARADSLFQLTETAGVDEAFVGADGCSTGGAAAPAAVLAALGLLRLRRRRG